MRYIAEIINPGMKLDTIKSLCEAYMLNHGADSFWYYDVGCFIFSGTETAVSASGKNYIVSERIIENDDIITIDLSPQCNNIWGDYARTFIVQGGNVCVNAHSIINPEWQAGLRMEEYLHRMLFEMVTKETSFEELFCLMNDIITRRGFENLDFLQNLGHSIEKNMSGRIYIEKGNCEKLSSVNAFTFEPHIRAKGSSYGYKMENIYSFQDGVLVTI